jgi:hypothetical protein
MAASNGHGNGPLDSVRSREFLYSLNEYWGFNMNLLNRLSSQYLQQIGCKYHHYIVMPERGLAPFSTRGNHVIQCNSREPIIFRSFLLLQLADPWFIPSSLWENPELVLQGSEVIRQSVRSDSSKIPRALDLTYDTKRSPVATEEEKGHRKLLDLWTGSLGNFQPWREYL